jgi:hypothetical protein
MSGITGARAVPVTIQLGKNMGDPGLGGCVRSVSATSDAPQIDKTCRGDASRSYFAGFKTATVEIECLDDPGVEPGDDVTLTAGHASGPFKVMSIAKSEPLDDVVTYRVTCMRTNPSAP